MGTPPRQSLWSEFKTETWGGRIDIIANLTTLIGVPSVIAIVTSLPSVDANKLSNPEFYGFLAITTLASAFYLLILILIIFLTFKAWGEEDIAVRIVAGVIVLALFFVVLFTGIALALGLFVPFFKSIQ